MAEAKDARISYRGTSEQRKRLKSIANERDISVQQILDEAVQAYLERDEPVGTGSDPEPYSADPAIAPQDHHERAVVAAALAFDREPDLPEEFREILFVLLKRWSCRGVQVQFREEDGVTDLELIRILERAVERTKQLVGPILESDHADAALFRFRIGWDK